MNEYLSTRPLDALIRLIDEAYPGNFFRRTYEETKSDSSPMCNGSIEEEVARCLINVILENYSDASSPESNLQRVAGEVDRFAHLVGEVQVRLAEIGEVYGDADETAALHLADKPIRS